MIPPHVGRDLLVLILVVAVLLVAALTRFANNQKEKVQEIPNFDPHEHIQNEELDESLYFGQTDDLVALAALRLHAQNCERCSPRLEKIGIIESKVRLRLAS